MAVFRLGVGSWVVVFLTGSLFAANPDDPGSPPVKNIVLRSEASVDETFIRMAMDPADPGRASVVIFESGEGEDSIFAGFSIKGGQGTFDLGGNKAGGGILFEEGSSPSVKNCIVSETRFAASSRRENRQGLLGHVEASIGRHVSGLLALEFGEDSHETR